MKMLRVVPGILFTFVTFLTGLASLAPTAALAASNLPKILSFSVGPDETLTWPNSASDPPYLVDLPDEHTTFIPLGGGPNNYLVFGASKLSGGTSGAVVLRTSDLKNFQFATSLGYARQVLSSPVAIDQCNPVYATEFDENYAAPGSVLQDPTLPPGNLMMFYEAENHCPGGVNQHFYYATVGFARSSDNGKTWPASVNSVLGGPSRHPVLKGPNPQPATNTTTAMGNAIPSAFVDRSASGDYYVYVNYSYNDGGLAPSTDRQVRTARARLGVDPVVFQKWYNGAFSQQGIGGVDSTVLPAPGCAPNTRQTMSEVSYNDDLGAYLMVFVCISGPTGSRVGAWYYSLASSLDLQDWSAPQMIGNSQFPETEPCPGLTTGGDFDGWYPSMMSPGAVAGHTKLTGHVFFQSGCDAGPRKFMSRTFTITPSEVNYTALWWNPAESGWGVNLNHQGNTIFSTLFTYDAAGSPLWLVMSGGTLQADGSTYSGTLYRTTGPTFNANPFTPIGAANITPVGTMSLKFSGATTGTLSYTYNGTPVTKPVQVQVYGSRAASCLPTIGSRASLTNYQDLWWNPNESGWGVNVTHQDNTLFATLFDYDAAGKGLWLVMSAGVKQADGSFLGDLYQTTGSAFNAQPFLPLTSANITKVGTMRFSFSDGNTGTLAYTVNGVSVSKAITRQVFSSPVPACD
jgi:hypothetical protein